MDKKVLLELSNGLKIELPILSGTIGPDVLNIKDLYKTTGLFTYDRSAWRVNILSRAFAKRALLSLSTASPNIIFKKFSL